MSADSCWQFVLAGLASAASAFAAPQIATTSLPAATIGVSYSVTLNATGGAPPYRNWSLTTGSLPLGLTLNAATGTISGTPAIFFSSNFTANFSVTVEDSQNSLAPAHALSIGVATGVTVSTLSLPGGSVGVPYSQTLMATGGAGAPYTWALVSGALPSGLNLNTATGVISGTPGTATGSPFSFGVTASDAAGRTSGAKGLSIAIPASTQPTTLSLTSSANPATYGQPVKLTAAVTPTGATGVVTFYDGVNILESMPVSGSQAVLSTIGLYPASNALKAYFSGLPTYLPSTSPVLAETVHALAGIGFKTPSAFAVGAGTTGPFSLAAADINNDGIADLVEFPEGVLLGNGDGTFQAPKPFSGGVPVTVGDFNQDGKPDLATASGVLLGNGDGTFQPLIPYPPGSGTVAAAGDFNGDGKPDLATTTGVLPGNGDGTFQNPMLYPPAGGGGNLAGTVTVADFNGDGKPDVFLISAFPISQSEDYKGVLYTGNGDGTFQMTVTGIDFGASINPASVAVLSADFNGDGKVDLAAIQNTLALYLNNGDGTFSAGAIYDVSLSSAPAKTASAALGDFNGDGNLDVAVADPANDSVDVFLGNGDGTFQKPAMWGVNGSVVAVAVGDFNRDGRADIASLMPRFLSPNSQDAVSILLGASSPQPPSITPGGVVPLYSTSTTIQPGEFVSIYGSNLATSTVLWNGDFQTSTSLGGTSVTINGKPAYLIYVSSGQIDLQAPDDTITGPVQVSVTTANGTGTSTVTLGPIAPSFLLLDTEHVAGIILRANGSGAYGGGTYDIIGPTGKALGYPTVAAKAGDILELFGVGFGPTTPFAPAGQLLSATTAPVTTNSVQLSIGGKTVQPSFSGLSEEGLYQLNLTIPANLGVGDLALIATVGGVQTQTGVVISLQ